MRRNRGHKPRKKPSQARSRVTVDAILRAAAHIFSQRGYGGANTNHIAKRAGVSIGSVYQYFPNKDALLVALMEQHMDAGEAALKKVGVDAILGRWTLPQTVTRYVAVVMELHTREPALQRVILHETPRSAALLRRLHRVEEQSARLLSTLLTERFDLDVPHSGHVAYMLVHTVEALVHEFVVHPPENMSERAFKAELAAMVLAYLRTPCPRQCLAC